MSELELYKRSSLIAGKALQEILIQLRQTRDESCVLCHAPLGEYHAENCIATIAVYAFKEVDRLKASEINA